MRKRYRCRDGCCGAVHHYLPAEGKCQRCGRRGMVRESSGLIEVIAQAVHGDSRMKQRELFESH